MIKADLTILNKLGLHARPASKLVKIAAQGKSEVLFIKDGLRANARSILGVILLQAEQGSKIRVEVDGVDEESMMQQFREIIADKFGED